MSTMLFQDGNAQATVHGREWMHFHGLCNQAARQVGVYEGLYNQGPMLNAGIKSGDDAIILAARIHGQSEDIVFVDGSNRAWLAGIIESGCARGVLRAEMGWDGVVRLLRSSDSEVVVITTSQGESFPNMALAIEHEAWSPSDPNDGGDDEWYDVVSEADRWTHGLSALRAREQTIDCGWELKPENWHEFRFATN